MQKAPKEPAVVRSSRGYRKLLSTFGLLLVLVVVGIGSYLTYLFFSSPPVIRNPYLQHYHLRAQIIVDGQAVNFTDQKFQSPESNISCDIALPPVPFHLHDDRDQVVHVHWDGMTGGLFLKDYGWNYVGGINGVLGYRYDHLPHIVKVPIHADVLQRPAVSDNFYVYSGNQSSYKQRSFDDFLNQDFETFFGVHSILPSSKPTSGFLNALFPKAYASKLNDQQLTRLNNLIGNVVIFAQKQKPSDAQINDHFSHLAPLSESVCGS